jgi:hypothetical protein
MRDGGPPRDGEADLVIVHAEHGFLVLEVRQPGRSTAWCAGTSRTTGRIFSRPPGSRHPCDDRARRHRTPGAGGAAGVTAWGAWRDHGRRQGNLDARSGGRHTFYVVTT